MKLTDEGRAACERVERLLRERRIWSSDTKAATRARRAEGALICAAWKTVFALAAERAAAVAHVAVREPHDDGYEYNAGYVDGRDDAVYALANGLHTRNL